MRASDARAGGWLSVLPRTCRCGAPAADLEPAMEGDARRAAAGGAVLAVLLVPDRWPEN